MGQRRERRGWIGRAMKGERDKESGREGGRRGW